MIEKERLNIIEKPFGVPSSTINLDISHRETIPFTSSEIAYAHTQVGEKVVVKIPSTKERAEHEWIGLKKVYEARVSVPKPIALVSNPEGKLAILSGFIEGKNLYYNPNSAIKVEIGRQIKKMHKHAEIQGKVWESSGRKSFVYYDKHIFNWASSGLEELNIGSETISLLEKLTGTAIDYCRNTRPVFNHNDLHDGQIIVDDKQHPTIIDFGNWTEESWMNEMGYHLFHLIRTDRVEPEDFANFLLGYLKNKQLSEVEKTTLAFYLLFISGRALNYFGETQSSYLEIAKENHKKVLEYIEKETIWKKY